MCTYIKVKLNSKKMTTIKHISKNYRFEKHKLKSYYEVKVDIINIYLK